ncbi:MAG: hypothetical protein E7006_00310 [Alphaproteobacteria bacterium]|nr:hypothetical protein [Alphaproteobacteria bacterium]
MKKLSEPLTEALIIAQQLQEDNSYPYVTRCSLKAQEFFLRRMLIAVRRIEQIKTKARAKHR